MYLDAVPIPRSWRIDPARWAAAADQENWNNGGHLVTSFLRFVKLNVFVGKRGGQKENVYCIYVYILYIFEQKEGEKKEKVVRFMPNYFLVTP